MLATKLLRRRAKAPARVPQRVYRATSDRLPGARARLIVFTRDRIEHQVDASNGQSMSFLVSRQFAARTLRMWRANGYPIRKEVL